MEIRPTLWWKKQIQHTSSKILHCQIEIKVMKQKLGDIELSIHWQFDTIIIIITVILKLFDHLGPLPLFMGKFTKIFELETSAFVETKSFFSITTFLAHWRVTMLCFYIKRKPYWCQLQIWFSLKRKFYATEIKEYTNSVESENQNQKSFIRTLGEDDAGLVKKIRGQTY